MSGKTNFDISKQRQIDLINAYKDVAKSCWSQEEAYIKTVNHPAPRYYITPKQAYQRIIPMMRGDFDIVDMMQERKRALYYSLFEEVVKLSEQRNFIGKSLWQIVQFAVLQPAPQFFIGWKHAKNMRIMIKKGYYDENGKIREDKVPYYKTKRENKRKELEEKRRWMLEKMSKEAKVTV